MKIPNDNMNILEYILDFFTVNKYMDYTFFFNFSFFLSYNPLPSAIILPPKCLTGGIVF